MKSVCWVLAAASLFTVAPVFSDARNEEGDDEDDIAAQSIDAIEANAVSLELEAIEEQDIDVQGSIDDAEERRGFGLNGDLRLGYAFEGDDFQDVTFGKTDVLRARWRVQATWGFAERFRSVFRVAGICSTEDCSPDFIMQPDIPTAASIEDGQITIDAFFVQWFRSDRFDLAIGRGETKRVARGGVFSKSLDRNDSNNLRVNWTDGLHGTFKAANGWESSMILQYNAEDGASNVRRQPLDFSDRESRVSYMYSLEKLQYGRGLIQSAVDISYLPSSLLVDGQPGGPVDDYLTIVARMAGRWPVRTEGWRIRLSSEIGYAPNTPTKFAAGIVGTGDTDGFAWNITVSLMDFLPKHSIGVNFAQTEAGWLLSPQYGDNEQLAEIRYMWRATNRMTIDVRGRWRDDMNQRIIENPGQDRFDFYARMTWSFDLKDY